MDKQEVLERLAQVQSVVERLPDDVECIHIYLESGLSLYRGNSFPEIHFCGDDYFFRATSLFHAKPTRVPRDHETWDAEEEFYVDGVRLFRLINTKEENEHGEQGSKIYEHSENALSAPSDKRPDGDGVKRRTVTG